MTAVFLNCRIISQLNVTELINLMINKGDKEILTDAVLYGRYICQLKPVMIDCKINNVNEDAVDISDRCISEENLVYVLKLDVLAVNVTEIKRMRRIDLRVEKVKIKRKI